jgi:RluA family pseudouridine synthase
MNIPKIPKKYRPKGFDILYEDQDLIIGNKAAGYLTVAALWEKENTIHGILNSYIRKGNARSQKSVYVVHRLDQATSGVLMFAKTPEVQDFMKDNWKTTVKNYYAVVRGHLEKKHDTISSYLVEDEDYVVSSTTDTERGKLAMTEYTVLKEDKQVSLLKINLLTGKKNQIRVHMAELGHPIVGDAKYGKEKSARPNLLLHSHSIEFTHPFSKKRIAIQAPVPDYFRRAIDFAF